MRFLIDKLYTRLNAVSIILLSFLIPSVSLSDCYSWRMNFFLFLLIAASAAFYLKFSKSTTLFLERFIDFLVLLSLWIGLFAISMETPYPMLSIRNFPDFHNYFPVLFCLGVIFLIYMIRNNEMPVYFIGPGMILLMTSLPFTRPLDQNIFGMSYPLMGLLYTLQRSTRIFSSIKRKFSFILIGSLSVVLLGIQAFRAHYFDFTQIIPKLLFLTVGILSFFMFWLIGSVNAKKTTALFRKFNAWHVLLIALPGLSWFVWMVYTSGFLSILKYRLWIALLHPNALGVFFAMMVFISEPWLFAAEKRKSGYVLFLVTVLMLTFTQSRGAISAAIIVGYFIFAFHNKKIHSKLLKSGMVLAFIVAVLLSWRVRYRLFDTGMLNDRFALWKPVFTNLSFLKTKLLFGFGIGAKQQLAEMITPAHSNLEFIRLWMSWDHLGQHFHNIYIEIFWLAGFAGILLAGAIILSVYRKETSAGNLTGLKAAFTILLLSGLVDCPIYYPAIMILLCSIAGIISGSKTPEVVQSHQDTSKNTRQFDFLPAATLIIFFLEFCLIVNPLRTQFMLVQGTDEDREEESRYEYLLNATKQIPPSINAAEQIVNILIEKNQCSELEGFLKKLPEKTRMQSCLLRYTYICLIEDAEIRSDYFAEIIKNDPEGVTELDVLPVIALTMFSFDEIKGREIFKRALLKDDRLVQSLMNFGHLDQDDLVLPKEKIAEWEKIRGLSAYKCTSYFQDIRIPIRNIFREVEKDFEKKPGLFLESERISFFKSVLYSGNYHEAIRLADLLDIDLSANMMKKEIRTYSSDSPDYALIQASKAFNEGLFDDSMRFLETAGTAEKLSTEWYYLEGLVFSARKNWKAALRDFDNALRLDPDNVLILTGKAESLYKLGFIEESLFLFKRILRETPWSIKAHKYCGIIYMNSKNYSQAYPHLDFVTRVSSKDIDINFKLYECLNNLKGREKDAVELEKKLIIQSDAFKTSSGKSKMRNRANNEH